jgi:hypothetical protein
VRTRTGLIKREADMGNCANKQAKASAKSEKDKSQRTHSHLSSYRFFIFAMPEWQFLLSCNMFVRLRDA